MDQFDRIFANDPAMADAARRRHAELVSIDAPMFPKKLRLDLTLADLRATKEYFNRDSTARGYYTDLDGWTDFAIKNLLFPILSGLSRGDRARIELQLTNHPSRTSDAKAIAKFLQRCAELYGPDIRVIDFGGNVGTCFYSAGCQFDAVRRYTVVELPAAVRVGAELATRLMTIDAAQLERLIREATILHGSSGEYAKLTASAAGPILDRVQRLDFAESLPDDLSDSVVVINGVTMHLDDPKGTLEDIVRRNPKALMIGNNMYQPESIERDYGAEFLVVQGVGGHGDEANLEHIFSLATYGKFLEFAGAESFRLCLTENRFPRHVELFYDETKAKVSLDFMRIADHFLFT